MNTWNDNRRFTRLHLDTESDIWLRADFPVSHGNLLCLISSLEDCLKAFLAAMLEYQAYILSEAKQYEQNIDEDIEKYTKAFVCDAKHSGERCVVCLDRLKEGESCIKLP